MCGIIGYSGFRDTSSVLLDGLKKLEYRGYDSAGVCLVGNNKKEIIKSVGRVSNLEEKIKKKSTISSTMGIAHTRWATNGKPTIENSHPHNVGKVTLVHNGIIENADTLRKMLIKKGYEFKSETDTEVAAALIDYNLVDEKNVIKAIDKAIKEFTGSYALVIIIEGENYLFATRNDAPLIIGVGENENFAASDVTAISEYTNKYIFLDDLEIAKVDAKKIEIYNKLEKIEKEINENKFLSNDTSKNGFSHYMLKEIMEEPICLERLFDEYLDNLELFDISKYKEINIVACGSAMYAGLIGKDLIEEYADIKVDVDVASEYRYKKKIFTDKEHTLVILISQSGETADTIAALREIKKLGIDTLGIVNNPNSTIAREADKTILTLGGVEIAVATTKAYILQVTVLSLMAIKTGISKKIVNKNKLDEFRKVIPLVKEVLENSRNYKDVADKIFNMNNCFFIGRGIDYSISMEGSLKLKEISYINSQAYQAGELKHGTISLIEKDMIVFSVITDKKLKDKTISNLKEVEARGAKGVVITTKLLAEEDDRLKIVVPDTEYFLQPIITVPVLQLLSFYIALNRNCDIDKPRNLAKSVTVE